MKSLLLALLLSSLSGCGLLLQNEYAPYQTKNKPTHIVAVDIVGRDDVGAACSQQTQKHAFSSFLILGCAAWTEKTCSITLPPKTQAMVLGHELRHCFEGNFHD